LPADPDEFDRVLRPNLIRRSGLPLLAIAFALEAVADRSWWTALAAVTSLVGSMDAWRSVVIVIEPTLLRRDLSGWSELHLDELRRIEMFWGGKFPTRHLLLTDATGTTLWFHSRLWWQSADRRHLDTIVARWARSAESEGRLTIKGRGAVRRLLDSSPGLR
jgi:hypothetical protein